MWTSIPLGITAVLAFTTPDFSYNGKVIYAVVTYTLLLLLYAGSNLPYSALSGVITGDMKERNSISAYRFVAVMFAQFFVQVFMLPIINYVGGGDKALGIEITMTWLAVIGTILLLITFITTKERIVPKPEQKSSILEDVKDLIKNRVVIYGSGSAGRQLLSFLKESQEYKPIFFIDDNPYQVESVYNDNQHTVCVHFSVCDLIKPYMPKAVGASLEPTSWDDLVSKLINRLKERIPHTGKII